MPSTSEIEQTLRAETEQTLRAAEQAPRATEQTLRAETEQTLRAETEQTPRAAEQAPRADTEQAPRAAEQTLRAAGLRVTRPRIAVLNAVQVQPHADTNTIIEAARTQLGDVSHQAVYDVLQALTSAGLLRRIQPSGSVARYEARVADNHHHIVCRACGAVADVDCAVGSAPCLTPSEAHGYAVDEAEVIYWGVCPTCSSASAGAAEITRA